MRLAFIPALAFLVSASVCVAAEERVIAKQAVVKASVDAVWDAWTTTEGVKSFFASDARVEARPGGAFEIYFNPYGAPGAKGAEDMRFLALQPKRMLSFTWNAPPYFPEIRGQRTSVVVRMRPAGDGMTQVNLVHSGWGDGGQWDQVYAYFDKAWASVLANLEKRFAEGPIDWRPFLERLKAAPEKGK